MTFQIDEVYDTMDGDGAPFFLVGYLTIPKNK
jgi:hypothetical protein